MILTIQTTFTVGQRIRHKVQRNHVGVVYRLEISVGWTDSIVIKYQIMWDKGIDGYNLLSSDVIEPE